MNSKRRRRVVYIQNVCERLTNKVFDSNPLVFSAAIVLFVVSIPIYYILRRFFPDPWICLVSEAVAWVVVVLAIYNSRHTERKLGSE